MNYTFFKSGLRLLTFFFFVLLLNSCRKSIYDPIAKSHPVPNNLSIEDARKHFESIKTVRRSATANTTATENRHPVWEDFQYRDLSLGNQAVITPIHNKNVYIQIDQKRAVKYGFLNYLMMYRDTSNSIVTELITLLPSAKWIDATHTRKYDGTIIVKDWDGKVKRVLNYRDGQVLSKSTTKRSVSGSGDAECVVLTTVKIKPVPAQPCGCEPHHNYSQIEQCKCSVKPTTASTVLIEEMEVDCPDDDGPSTPGGGSNDNGSGGDSPSGNGGGGSGTPTPGDYTPDNCNDDPNYTVPTIPPPPGEEWAVPCSGGGVPIENIDTEEDPVSKTTAQLIAEAFINNQIPVSETSMQWLGANPDIADNMYSYLTSAENSDLIKIAEWGIDKMQAGELTWSEFNVIKNYSINEQDAIDFIDQMSNPITEDPIEFYLVAMHTGSKIFDLAIKSKGPSIQVGEYSLMGHYDKNDRLIFYSASRPNATYYDMATLRQRHIGIEFIIKADALQNFRDNVDILRAASDLFYVNGIPNKNTVLYAAGKTFEQRWEGVKGMWGTALRSPEWWAFTILSAMHTATSIEGNITKTVIKNEVAVLREKVGTPLHWIEKASKKDGGIIFQDPLNTRNRIRVMPGNPLSEFPSQHKPYVKFQKEGAHYDKNGIQINTGDIPEAHIPLSEFDISKMPKFD